MLYLVVDAQGKPDHRWSIDPKKDFAGIKVFGEALRDETGNYCDSAWLGMNAGVPFFDPAMKSAAIAKERTDTLAKEQAVKDRMDRIKALMKTETGLAKELAALLMGE